MQTSHHNNIRGNFSTFICVPIVPTFESEKYSMPVWQPHSHKMFETHHERKQSNYTQYPYSYTHAYTETVLFVSRQQLAIA